MHRRLLAALILTLPLTTPGWAAPCGRVNTFTVMPRSQQLFPSALLQVDGTNAGTTGQQDFRLAPGRHTLRVGERIDPREFDSMANRQRGHLPPQELELQVDIQPGTTYMLAAKLLDPSPSAIIGKRYWQPVIWKTLAETCH